jgi:hypothetical protein
MGGLLLKFARIATCARSPPRPSGRGFLRDSQSKRWPGYGDDDASALNRNADGGGGWSTQTGASTDCALRIHAEGDEVPPDEHEPRGRFAAHAFTLCRVAGGEWKVLN